MDQRALAFAEEVARGQGFVTGQSHERSSEIEQAFRASVEQRKRDMLGARRRVRHPALISDRELEQARRNIETADWARQWFDRLKDDADFIAGQDEGYVDRMLEAETPWCGYSFFCPNCFGIKSFEGTEYTIIDWQRGSPDTLTCKACGHVYPSAQYPEDITLQCPRRGQSIAFHRNPAQRANPDDRTGDLAWRWAMRPVHPSFTGIIRERKAMYLVSNARPLALLHRLTGEVRYARRSREILLRLAWCFRHAWMYHDYWDTAADCDPIYAAWHDKKLPLEWKRNLFTSAYEADQPDSAAMRQGYWGAGRLHPSTGMVGVLPGLCDAYDLLCAAKDEQGGAILSEEDRRTIEMDLLLEWIIEAEPFVGGEGRTENASNKAPRVYHAMAAIAKCLGLTDYARTALAGYEVVRDRSFAHDGFSHETPSYNEMFLGELLWIPERLHGFAFPSQGGQTGERVNLYRTDAKLRLMLQACMDQLRPDGRRLPWGDSHEETVAREGGSMIWEVGLKRLPATFADRVPMIYQHRGMTPTEYAVLRLPATVFDRAADGDRPAGLALPELCFPGWMTALLRNGDGLDGSIASLSFSPAGGHRHYDNLALYYADRGRTVLGDHGYLAEAPAQRWIKHTFSHNLVIVDEQVQAFRSEMEREPAFEFMVTSPLASAVAASSKVYEQCDLFARTIVMLKGPDGKSLLVDIFRVRGGKRHAYRLFSEIASSDAGVQGSRTFEGIAMPTEPPLPDIGASERDEDIFGLRDAVTCDTPADHWQTTWREPDAAYRLWMLTGSDHVVAANGPGQEMWGNPAHVGRRVRYVDVIRESATAGLHSTFVAVHEPAAVDGALPVHHVERLETPPDAGPDAVALRIVTTWGAYVVLSDFTAPAEVAGVRFQGRVAVLRLNGASHVAYLTVGASVLQHKREGFKDSPAQWCGQVRDAESDRLSSDTPRPARWSRTPREVGNYVAVRGEKRVTGYPVRGTTASDIRIARFPLDMPQSFVLPAVRYKPLP
jgi:hypothetical protein